MNLPKGKHTPLLFAGSNFRIEGSKKWNLIVVKGFDIPERNKKKQKSVSIMIKKRARQTAMDCLSANVPPHPIHIGISAHMIRDRCCKRFCFSIGKLGKVGDKRFVFWGDAAIKIDVHRFTACFECGGSFLCHFGVVHKCSRAKDARGVRWRRPAATGRCRRTFAVKFNVTGIDVHGIKICVVHFGLPICGGILTTKKNNAKNKR